MREIHYQCPISMLECHTPDKPWCIYTRNSKDEFDQAQPGDKLVLQMKDLMCDGPLAPKLPRTPSKST